MKTMRNVRVSLILIVCFLSIAPIGWLSGQAQTGTNSTYYPAPGDAWQRRKPEDAGMDSALLEQALAYAKTQAGTMPADFSTQVETFGRVLGPLPKMHGDTGGIIIRHGYIVAEWGDTNRIDPLYSVAKSFLSPLAGIAGDRGMSKNVHDPMKLYAKDDGYASPHNAKVTWEN